ncbi:uncharacterized protein LOC107268111 [Cephus cinctus]|uniref:Uncharacterized protein LOC107268111 n=1 Tax=Cephus cinctus TaxID=211228 RepID=A0AAJ7FKA1_CEPCN|nr:uncharacterized protein LOC107268111 [Cephus cinctus]
MRGTRGSWRVVGVLAFLCLLHMRLASDENEESSRTGTAKSHSDDARQHLCCARHEKMIDVGYGISGEVIQIDAGHCRRLCPRHAFDDPGDASRPAVERCPPDWHCRPSRARLERVSTVQGVRVIEAIDSCDCATKQSCTRESYVHVLHPGTPHQIDMDVGLCTGHCAKGRPRL